MIQLKEGLNENVVYTLTEFSKLSNPNYLFLFKNEQTNKEKLFFAQDKSLNKARYNLFDITLVNNLLNENLTGGTIYLTNFGFYEYEVFETTGTTLSFSGLNRVEYGRVNYQPSANTTYTSYNNTTYNKATIKDI